MLRNQPPALRNLPLRLYPQYHHLDGEPAGTCRVCALPHVPACPPPILQLSAVTQSCLTALPAALAVRPQLGHHLEALEAEPVGCAQRPARGCGALSGANAPHPCTVHAAPHAPTPLPFAPLAVDARNALAEWSDRRLQISAWERTYTQFGLPCPCSRCCSTFDGYFSESFSSLFSALLTWPACGYRSPSALAVASHS